MKNLSLKKIAQLIVIVIVIGAVLSNFGMLLKWIIIGSVVTVIGIFAWSFYETIQEEKDKN